jgi:hypothetical protein
MTVADRSAGRGAAVPVTGARAVHERDRTDPQSLS